MDTEKLVDFIKNENEQTRRHFDVVAASLRSDIGKVAEGVVALNDRVGKLEIGQQRLESRMERVEIGIQVMRQDLKGFQEETRKEFKEVKSQIKISYTVLDERVTRLENVVTNLQGRVELLESRI